jgi:predicted alpha-1,2-mannosidase
MNKTLLWLGSVLAFSLCMTGCRPAVEAPPFSETDAEQDATQAPDGVDSSEDASVVDADSPSDTDGFDENALIDGHDALGWVDPFVGTKGEWFGYAALTPATQMPYGLVRLGPDTSIGTSYIPFHHFSGYHYLDPDVRGFSHLHFIGTGVVDYGNIRVLPRREVPDVTPSHWHTPMDKATETASPGYYSVHLPAERTLVELTASYHGGLHRYRFDEGGTGYLTIDAGASVTSRDVLASQVAVDGSRITGWATHRGAYTGRTRPFTVYFSMTVEPAPSEAWVWKDGAYAQSSTSAEGSLVGAILRFDEVEGPVELRVGVSIVDLDAAEANRQAQLEGKSFEEVHEAARAAWSDKLGRVRIKGATRDVTRMFYTSLYNAYRMPTRFDGVDGRYRGLDGEVHQAQGWTYYTDLSLWDTFRTLHPWLTLTDVDEQRDVLRSLMAMREQGGYFPRWPAAISYTGGMIGTWAEVLFAEGALKGIDGIDYAEAYEGVREIAMGPTEPGHPYGGRPGIEPYIELGYVPEEATSVAVSRTLEYAWGDFAIANLAGYLGKDEDESLFRERARSYRNLFHPESQFFRPRRSDGTFDLSAPPERVYMSGGPYTEGNAWHWRFYALHDPQGLVELFGSAEAFKSALSEFFTRSALGKEGPIDHKTPDLYYWHGNEPTLHSALLFHAVDAYDDVAQWVREIQTRLYTDGPPGNDDGGTLSSWYLFNALGLYPVAGSERYLLSIPLIPYAEVDTASGTLIIEAPGAKPQPQRVASVSLDGSAIEGAELRHAQLLDGRLFFEIADP